MSEITDRYYSMPEICKYLGISRDTALRWIATKNMPAHKDGKIGSSKFLKSTSGLIADKRKNRKIIILIL